MSAVVTRPDGLEFLVRPVERSDIASLSALFSTLSFEDRHLRFFSLFNPPPEFFERLVNLGTEDGQPGAALVVEPVGGTRHPPHLVAEADYVTLPNGDAEFSIMVEKEWRGWLGGALLDELAEVAAANGIPNLEADILAMNRRMLGVMHKRGYAFMDHTDFDTVRVISGTSGSAPTWPADDGPRLLVEAASGCWPGEEEARAAGFRVITCAGPDARVPGVTPPCPALDGSGSACPLAAGADVILCAFPGDDVTGELLLGAHARLHCNAALYERIENLYALIESLKI